MRYLIAGALFFLALGSTRNALASESGSVKLLSSHDTLTDAATGEAHILLSATGAARYVVVGPARLQVELRLNRPAGSDSGPGGTFEIHKARKPLRRFRLAAARGEGGAWKEDSAPTPSARVGLYLDVADGPHVYEFHLDAKNGGGLRVVPASDASRPLSAGAPVIPAVTSAASSSSPESEPEPKPTPAATVAKKPEPAPTREPAANTSEPASTSGESVTKKPDEEAPPTRTAAVERGPREGGRFDVTPELGYVLNGGDLHTPMAGLGFGWKPVRDGRFRSLSIRFGVEYYGAEGSRTVTDPTLGEFTRSFEFTVLPVVLGIGWSKGMGPVDLVTEADIGMFVIDGAWKADNEQGSIEPASKVGGISPGLRLGIGATRALGPGSLIGMIRLRQVNVANSERFDPVYPQKSAAYETLGDLGGMSATVGYRFSF